MARQVGCRECDKVTSGDCGQHGPLVVQMTSEVQYQPVAWPELAKKVRAEGYAAGRAEVLAMVRKLPSPIVVRENGAWCDWCHTGWLINVTAVVAVPSTHPSNGCLFVLAQETGKEQA